MAPILPKRGAVMKEAADLYPPVSHLKMSDHTLQSVA